MTLSVITLYVSPSFPEPLNMESYSQQPVFFVRDPVRFPSLNRSHKRHPATNRPDPTMVSLSVFPQWRG